jgi:glycosyltransferase involved in cell wall biosynthesis
VVSISVIIPAHNEEKYIKQTLHALKQQTFQNFEIIVVANGCTDKTEEIVAKRSNVNLLKISKPNVSRARNHGAGKAAGNLLVFLDADTILDPETLQKINKNFNEEHSVGTTKVKPDNQDNKFRLHMFLKNLANKTGIYRGWISGVLICRKADFDKVNGYDHTRILREHRNLILKLLKLESKKFTLIDTYSTTSMRRFQDWGLLKATSFWLKQLARDNFGDISKSDYEKIR